MLHTPRAGWRPTPDRRSRAFPNKRWFWIIFHGKLRAFCASLTEEARRQGQGKVDSRCHARAGRPVAIDDDALAHGHRAEIGELIEREPMACGPVAGEEPRCSQNKGSRANRRHIAGVTRLPPQKGENLFIFHERDLPRSAGDEKNVRLWAAGESVSRQDSQAVHVGYGIERFPDEMKVQFLEPCEYLEWPGEIELLEPGIKQHHDLHQGLHYQA
jgi:hypothetical protein